MVRELLLASKAVPPFHVHRYIEGDLKETMIPAFGVTARRLMQTLGTEWGRAIRPDLWVRLAMGAAETSVRLGQPVVIDDLRFKNEADAILRAGGILVRIERPGTDSGAAHVSEGALEDYEFTHRITNDAPDAAEYLRQCGAILGLATR